MITKIEDLEKIKELFDKMSDDDKDRLNSLLIARKEEYAVDPLGTVVSCVQEMFRQEVEKFTEYVNGQIEKSEPEGYARTIDDHHRVERGKAFVEAMSSQARANEELMQQRRDERYEKMIDEYDNLDSMKKSR